MACRSADDVDVALPGILEDVSAELSGALRMLLAQLKLELDHLAMRIDEAGGVIKKMRTKPVDCWLRSLALDL